MIVYNHTYIKTVMNMKKIMLAVESQILADALHNHLSPMYQVAVCYNGIDVMETIKAFDPDVLVVDLSLPETDGISLLQMIWDCGLRPKVIALTFSVTDYIVAALEKLQVSCLMRLTGDYRQLTARIIDLAHWEDTPAVETEVRKILAILGFKMNSVGCRITEIAICKYIENPYQSMMSELYPAVAAQCNGTVTQVEKAIRTGIEVALKEHDDRIWRMYFPAGKNGKVHKPTNAEFLARIAFCILDREDRKLNRKIIVS